MFLRILILLMLSVKSYMLRHGGGGCSLWNMPSHEPVACSERTERPYRGTT